MAKLSIRERAHEKEYASTIDHLPPQERADLMRRYRDDRERERAAAAMPEQSQPAQEPVQQEAVAVPVVPDKPKRRYLPSGPLTFVPCNVPGFEGLRFGYDLGAYWADVRGQTKNDDGLGGIRKLMSIVKSVEGWDFYDPLTDEPYPAPTPGDIEAYRLMCLRWRNLGDWLWDTSPEGGFGKALDLHLGEDWRRSSAPLKNSETT